MTDDVDARLSTLVEKIHSKVPADRKLTTAVVLQLLSSKFASQFPGVDFATKSDVISSVLQRLHPTVAAVAAPAKPVEATKQSDSNDKKSDESSDDEDSDDEDYNEEEDEEGEDSEDSGSDDEEEFDSEDSDSASGEADEEPELKKARTESNGTDDDLRVTEMLACLGKLSYRPRKRNEGETATAYLNDALIPYFVAKHLDPNAYDKEATRRYKVRKELADLQADGGNLNLEKTQRRGRLNVVVPPPVSSSAPKPMFMDEEEAE